MRIIHDFIKKFKGFNEKSNLDDIFLFLIIIFISLSSFALGRLSIEGTEKYNLSIEQDMDNKALWKEYEETFKKEKNYVASKKGTKYYKIGCSGVNRIKEENRVFFKNYSDAEVMGYERAKGC